MLSLRQASFRSWIKMGVTSFSWAKKAASSCGQLDPCFFLCWFDGPKRENRTWTQMHEHNQQKKLQKQTRIRAEKLPNSKIICVFVCSVLVNHGPRVKPLKHHMVIPHTLHGVEVHSELKLRKGIIFVHAAVLACNNGASWWWPPQKLQNLGNYRKKWDNPQLDTGVISPIIIYIVLTMPDESNEDANAKMRKDQCCSFSTIGQRLAKWNALRAPSNPNKVQWSNNWWIWLHKIFTGVFLFCTLWVQVLFIGTGSRFIQHGTRKLQPTSKQHGQIIVNFGQSVAELKSRGNPTDFFAGNGFLNGSNANHGSLVVQSGVFTHVCIKQRFGIYGLNLHRHLYQLSWYVVRMAHLYLIAPFGREKTIWPWKCVKMAFSENAANHWTNQWQKTTDESFFQNV